MEFKRGDTFHFVIPIQLDIPDGYFVGYEVPRVQIRNEGGNLMGECTTYWADPATTRVLHVKVPESVTRNWTIGTLYCDVEFVRISDNYTRSSNTASFECVRDITKPRVE